MYNFLRPVVPSANGYLMALQLTKYDRRSAAMVPGWPCGEGGTMYGFKMYDSLVYDAPPAARIISCLGG
jgi:hypothetical protein